MITEDHEAWIIHKQPSGDTSAWVTFFTREKGLLRCLWRGGRTPKKQGRLQTFMPLWIALDVRKSGSYIRDIESAAELLNLRGNALFSGLYLNELLYYLLKPMDAHPELFDSYLQTMNSLANNADKFALEILLRRFEWHLLESCGYSISFTEETHSSVPINATNYYQFIPGAGFITAAEGIPGRELMAIALGHLDNLQTLKIAKFIMRQAIDQLLGGRILKSREFARNISQMKF